MNFVYVTLFVSGSIFKVIFFFIISGKSRCLFYYYYYYYCYHLYAGYLNCIPETNHVTRAYSDSTVLCLQFVLHVMLLHMLHVSIVIIIIIIIIIIAVITRLVMFIYKAIYLPNFKGFIRCH